MSFIQAQQRLASHPKTLRLARLLGPVALDRYAVVGRLAPLWAWRHHHRRDNAPSSCLWTGGVA